MSVTNSRKQPRVPIRRSVSIELRAATTSVALGAKSTRVDLQGFTANFSRTGIALELAPNLDVPVGASVRITVQISGRNIALPGLVVWSRGGTDAVRAGVRLHPELTDSNSRRVFDTFVRDAERTLGT